jgi:hypothetical protein
MKTQNTSKNLFILALISVSFLGCGTFQDQSGIKLSDSKPNDAAVAPVTEVVAQPSPASTVLSSPEPDDESEETVIVENETKEIANDCFKHRMKFILRHHARVFIQKTHFEKGVEIEAYDDSKIEIRNSKLEPKKHGRNWRAEDGAQIHIEDENESHSIEGGTSGTHIPETSPHRRQNDAPHR